MKEQLIQNLHSYLVHHQTDLLIALQEDHRLTHYLEHKVGSVQELWEQLTEEGRPAYVVEALCMEELTRDLRPSRFDYVKAVLMTEFPRHLQQMTADGTLTYEVINLTGGCEPIFEAFFFSSANRDDPGLRTAVKALMAEYLEANIGSYGNDQ
jgi:hypothetical protein